MKFMYKLILTFLLSLSIVTVHGQQSLSGKYVAMLPHSGATTTIAFNGFNFIFTEDNGITQVHGSGKFTIKKDSLYLTYLETSNKDSSNYTIKFTDGTYTASTATVTVQVFDEATKQPFRYAHLTAKDKTAKPILTTIADVSGEANVILYPEQTINVIDIGAVGYYGAAIPVNKLLGKAANIVVFLRPAAKVYKPAGTVAYKVLRANGRQLVLQKGNEKITFTKQK